MKSFNRVIISAAVILFTGIGISIISSEKLYDFSIGMQRSSAGLEKKQINVGDHTIFYLEGGSGSETIVLIHGFGADKDNWPLMVKHLPGYHYVIPDLPGFGESTKLYTAKYDVVTQAERLDEFMVKLGFKSFYIGGNSMGGNISGIYAARYPDKVKALILLNNSGVTPPVKSEVFKLIENGTNPLLISSRDDFDRMLKFLFLKKPFIVYPFTGVLAEKAISSRGFNEKVFNDFISAPAMLEGRFAAMTMPVLIIWGDKDRILDVSSVAVLENGIKNHTTRILADCGHVPMIERPEETAGYIKSFIESSGVQNNKN